MRRGRLHHPPSGHQRAQGVRELADIRQGRPRQGYRDPQEAVPDVQFHHVVQRRHCVVCRRLRIPVLPPLVGGQLLNFEMSLLGVVSGATPHRRREGRAPQGPTDEKGSLPEFLLSVQENGRPFPFLWEVAQRPASIERVHEGVERKQGTGFIPGRLLSCRSAFK